MVRSLDHGRPPLRHDKKRPGVVVVVVVRTCVLHERVCPATSTVAPNHGGRVPVDTTPGPAPVCRALKTHPNTMMSCSSRRKPRQCNRGSTTVFSTTTHVDLSRPAQQGRRSPYQATGESLGPTAATAQRQEELCEELQLRKIRSFLHGDT